MFPPPANIQPLGLALLLSVDDAVVGSPDMLPGVEAQDGREAGFGNAAIGLFGLFQTAIGRDGGLLLVHPAVNAVGLGALAVGGVHVDGLAAVVGLGVGRAGEVCRQQAEDVPARRGLGLDEPDEARAEHGEGRDEELTLKRLDAAKVLLERLAQQLWHLDGLRGQTVEEKVVVVRHAGVVEGRGVEGIASGADGQVPQGVAAGADVVFLACCRAIGVC